MGGDAIELKLRLDADGVARLKRQPFLADLKLGRPSTARLSSVYWDTPEMDLARAGVVLRVRAIGNRRVQTVKTAGRSRGALFSRREWEWPVAGDSPDPALLRSTRLEPFLDSGTAARLRPVFSTELKRTLYRLGTAAWAIDLALDQGEVGAGGAREPVCEAELELVKGRPAQLFALAGRIAEAVPARLLALSKSDRGYQLASGTPPLPVKSTPTPVSSGMTVAEGFQAIARNCLDQLLANERCLLATRDPEAIHQMRVALRRLRSAIRIFRSAVAGPQLAHVKGDIAWLLGHLGPARDDYVFLAEIVEPVAAAHPETAPLASLRADWLAQHESALAAALAAVADRRFTALMLGLAAWVETGDWLAAADRPILARRIGPFARRMLTRRDKKLREAGGADLTALAPGDLHNVRILGKQLRYAGEFFAPLHAGKAASGFLAALAALQDVLGQINDIAVAEARLGGGQVDSARAWAAGLVAGWHAGRRPRLLGQAKLAWKTYRKAARFWR